MGRTRTRRAAHGPLLTVALLLAGLPAGTGGTAAAATPGANGLIAFETNRSGSTDIAVMAPDGSSQRVITNHEGSELDPAWSPDGTRIAFSSGQAGEGHQDVWVMDADGSDAVLLTPGAVTTDRGNGGVEPTWSPDGSRIAYAHNGELWVMSAADGGGKVRITPSGAVDRAPAWSPDGTRIAFIHDFDVWTTAPDGSARVRLAATSAAEQVVDWAPDGSALVVERAGQVWRTDADGSDPVALTSGVQESGVLPAWSPDGGQIVFATNSFGAQNGFDIAVMRADGTGERALPTAADRVDTDPSWQPLPRAGAPAPRNTDDACPPGEVPPNQFRDVADGSTHERAISCLVWWGVANGRTPTTYAPDAGVTRDAMAAFVARTVLAAAPGSLPDSPPDAFRDDEGSVHERSIDQLAAAGIVGGTGGGEYSPSRTVTRGQMARFLANAAAHVLDEPLPTGADLFPDDDDSLFEADIDRVGSAGITGGRADGTYDPGGLVTRDQMGSFLARTLDLFVDAGAQPPA